MSDTPRTDAIEDREDGSVNPDFTRQLERELAESQAREAALQRWKDQMQAKHDALWQHAEKLAIQLGIDQSYHCTEEAEEVLAAHEALKQSK